MVWERMRQLYISLSFWKLLVSTIEPMFDVWLFATHSYPPTYPSWIYTTSQVVYLNYREMHQQVPSSIAESMYSLTLQNDRRDFPDMIFKVYQENLSPRLITQCIPQLPFGSNRSSENILLPVVVLYGARISHSLACQCSLLVCTPVSRMLHQSYALTIHALHVTRL